MVEPNFLCIEIKKCIGDDHANGDGDYGIRNTFPNHNLGDTPAENIINKVIEFCIGKKQYYNGT